MLFFDQREAFGQLKKWNNLEVFPGILPFDFQFLLTEFHRNLIELGSTTARPKTWLLLAMDCFVRGQGVGEVPAVSDSQGRRTIGQA